MSGVKVILVLVAGQRELEGLASVKSERVENIVYLHIDNIFNTLSTLASCSYNVNLFT